MGDSCERVAVQAMEALGRGFDFTNDFRLRYCKSTGTGNTGNTGDCRLVELDYTCCHDLAIPGGPLIPNVPTEIACGKGERTRFKSDVLEFNRMSELFNQRSNVQGKIPSGYFNSAFTFSGSWLQDAQETKHLAFDAYFISLYNMHLTKASLVLKEEVRKSVPAEWNPSALCRFIETFGTHIIVGVEIGGQDVIFARQSPSSSVSPTELKRHLGNLGDLLFSDKLKSSFPQSNKRTTKQKVPGVFSNILHASNPVHLGSISTTSTKDGLTLIYSKRGGLVSLRKHQEWLQTVSDHPDAILFSLVPITSLLTGVPGSGFLSHAINLYLRYKPPREDLQYFLEFQVPRAWAPEYGDLPLGPPRRKDSFPSLQFIFMGPRLYVSSTQVSVGRRPVTGLRLYLEGRKCNRLAIHLQHLSSLPHVLQPFWDDSVSLEESRWQESDEKDCRFFEPIKWKNYSHVCTVAIKYDPRWVQEGGGVFVVTGAQLVVRTNWSKNVLHLRLLFTRLPNCFIERSVWDHAPNLSQKSKFLSTISHTFSTSSTSPKRTPVVLNSGIYPNGPPCPVQSQRLSQFVDTAEICRGPQDVPGHWLVTGAKLDAEKGKISLQVKFSLLQYSSPLTPRANERS